MLLGVWWSEDYSDLKFDINWLGVMMVGKSFFLEFVGNIEKVIELGIIC